jgi:hypothetical protein
MVFVLLNLSCRRDHYKVNISNIESQADVIRLEQDLFSADPGSIPGKIPQLSKKYGEFLGLFGHVINAGDIKDSTFAETLEMFCTDKQNNEVYDDVMKIFPDLDNLTSGLRNSIRHYIYYFPGKKIPDFFTCITGFNASIITGDTVLGIGLDRYLGADCKYYPMLGIYNYISARMTPENIVPDCMYGWAASEWNYNDMGYSSRNLLSEMIHEGKLKYFEKCMMPEITDELLFGFTKEQMKFCKNNEEQMWTYLIEHDLLFSTDQFTIRKFTGEAPFTSYFTKESPGRAAVWIGFRIAESYMMKNSGIELAALMSDTDVQKIVEKARYNPK